MKAVIVPVVASVVLALAGCAKDPPVISTTPSVTVLDIATLPEPDASGASLGPLDKVSIQVFGVDSLGREVQVDAGGHIAFPLVGSIKAGGHTTDEVARLIEDGLRAGYVKEPDVTVNLIETNSQTVAVEGEVDKPGVYPAAGRLTLLRTLAMAGGTTDLALQEQIIVFRDVAGQRYAGIYSLDALRRGLAPDPRVFANDTVVVGESPRRKALDRFIKVAPAFTSPLILLLTRI